MDDNLVKGNPQSNFPGSPSIELLEDDHNQTIFNKFEISVVICTYSFDRLDVLMGAIRSVQSQTLSPLEIIIVIDHNEELLHHLREEFPGLRVIPNRHLRGLSGARNSGVGVAQGDIIAFLDDDAIAAPDWIEKHLSKYSDQNVIGVGGKIEPLWESKRPKWFPYEFDWVVGCTYLGMPETPRIVNKVIGANMSFRREAFETVGGFPYGLGRIGSYPLAGEESEFCMRILKHWEKSFLLYDPGIKVQHRVPPSRANWRYFQRRCFYGGVSNYLLSLSIGKEIGLSAERQFSRKILPKGVIQYVREGFKSIQSFGFHKALVIIIGFILTGVGYLWGGIYSKTRTLDN